jgi:GNAT superfamily N-acetyltransferase
LKRHQGLPAVVELAGSTVVLRRATARDVAAIVGLLVDDPLGRVREHPAYQGDIQPYLAAFEDIDRDPHQLLVVANDGVEVLATMQLTFIAGLSRGGALRMQVEAVRVAASHRSRGLGAAMMTWAVEHARGRGCAVVQLTTDKSRVDAHRFYDRLGFVPSHVGYKLTLRGTQSQPAPQS